MARPTPTLRYIHTTHSWHLAQSHVWLHARRVKSEYGDEAAARKGGQELAAARRGGDRPAEGGSQGRTGQRRLRWRPLGGRGTHPSHRVMLGSSEPNHHRGCSETDFPYLGMPSPDTLLSAPALSPGTVRSLPLHPCPCIPGSHWHCDLHALSTRECTAYDVTFDQYVLDVPHTAALHTCYVGADDQHAAPQMTHSV